MRRIHAIVETCTAAHRALSFARPNAKELCSYATQLPRPRIITTSSRKRAEKKTALNTQRLLGPRRTGTDLNSTNWRRGRRRDLSPPRRLSTLYSCHRSSPAVVVRNTCRPAEDNIPAEGSLAAGSSPAVARRSSLDCLAGRSNLASGLNSMLAIDLEGRQDRRRSALGRAALDMMAADLRVRSAGSGC